MTMLKRMWRAVTMLKRMWRAFWVAMREPVRTYAPSGEVTIRVEVDSRDAEQRLQALVAKAERLRELDPRGRWLH